MKKHTALKAFMAGAGLGFVVYMAGVINVQGDIEDRLSNNSLRGKSLSKEDVCAAREIAYQHAWSLNQDEGKNVHEALTAFIDCQKNTGLTTLSLR